jgi:hypothetical protein
MWLEVFPELSQIGHWKLFVGIVIFPLHGEAHVRWDRVLNGLDLLFFFLRLIQSLFGYGLVDKPFGILLDTLCVSFILLFVQLFELDRTFSLLLFGWVLLMLRSNVAIVLDLHLLCLLLHYSDFKFYLFLSLSFFYIKREFIINTNLIISLF